MIASVQPRVAGRPTRGLVDVGPTYPRQSPVASSARAARALTVTNAALVSDSSFLAQASTAPRRPAKVPRLGGRFARVDAEATSASLDSEGGHITNARSLGLSELQPAVLQRSQPVTCSLQRIQSGLRGSGPDTYATTSSAGSASESPMPKLQNLDLASVSSPHTAIGSLQSAAVAASTVSSEASPVLHDSDDTSHEQHVAGSSSYEPVGACAEPERLLASAPGSSNSVSRLRTELESLTRDSLRLRCLEEGLDVDSKLSRAGYISALVGAATDGRMASATETPNVLSVRRLLARLAKNDLLRCAVLILGHDGWHEGLPTSKFHAIDSIMTSIAAGVTSESMARVAVEMARAGAHSSDSQPVTKSTTANGSAALQHCSIIDARTRLLLELRCMSKEALLSRASAHGFSAQTTVSLETVVQAVLKAEGSLRSDVVSEVNRINLTSLDEARRRRVPHDAKPASASVGKAATAPKPRRPGPTQRAALSHGTVDLPADNNGASCSAVPSVESRLANECDYRERDEDASAPLESATPLDTASLLCRALVWTYDCAAPESSTARRAATVTYQGAFVRNVTSGLNDYHGIGMYLCACLRASTPLYPFICPLSLQHMHPTLSRCRSC